MRCTYTSVLYRRRAASSGLAGYRLRQLYLTNKGTGQQPCGFPSVRAPNQSFSQARLSRLSSNDNSSSRAASGFILKRRPRRALPPSLTIPVLLLSFLPSAPLPPLLPLRGAPVVPKLDIAVQRAPLDEPPLLPHQVFHGYPLVAEDLEVVGDDVAVLAARAGDQDGPVVVPLLADLVLAAGAAGDAGECQLVLRRGGAGVVVRGLLRWG